MAEHLSDILNRPLTIGDKTIPNRLVLAPMTQVGNIAHRELIADFGGAGLMFSEMCGAQKIPTENRTVSAYFRWRDEERQSLSFQIVGEKPDEMAEAARRIEAEGLWGVDINFGCSVTTICKQNIGAAVLKEPDRAVAIVRAVRQAVTIPVSVKYRTGWVDDPKPAVDLAARFEDAGADALCFHPRTAPDRRSRPPRWPYISAVKKAVTIPVLGNGDVFTAEDCLAMLEQTGCDGVAIGRIAIARPWVFAQWTCRFSPDPDVFGRTALTLMKKLTAHFEPAKALSRFKKFSRYYAANFRFGHTFYSGIQNAPDLETAKKAVVRFFTNPPSVTSRPNQNFFM